eukprot:5134113-Amphidinium_carterae.1
MLLTSTYGVCGCDCACEDQKGTRFHTDLQLLEESDVMRLQPSSLFHAEGKRQWREGSALGTLRIDVRPLAQQDLDLLDDGAVILADNVLKPGAPQYIWHLAK